VIEEDSCRQKLAAAVVKKDLAQLQTAIALANSMYVAEALGLIIALDG